MPQQYTNISRKQLARGIDSFSAKSSLQEGYAEDLQNVDTSASGKLSTRTGYEGYYGWLPFRVTQVTHDGTAIRFQFSSASVLDLSTTTLGPLVAYGKISGSGGGDWTSTESVRYYPWFTITSRDALIGDGNTNQIVKTSAQHGITNQYIWTGLATSDSATELDNTSLIPENISIDTTSFTVELDYVSHEDTSAFVYFKDMSPATGSVYHLSMSPASATATASDSSGSLLWTSTAHGLLNGDAVEFTTGGTLPAGVALGTNYYVVEKTDDTFKLATTRGGTALTYTDVGTGTHTWNKRSYSATADTHGLTNFNVVVRCFDTALSAGSATQIIPDQWLIDSDGKVTVEFTSDVTGYAILAAAPLANSRTDSATVSGGGPTTNTLTIPSPGGEFLFFDVYRRTGNVLESVLVQDWSYDEATDEVTIEYVVSGSAGEAIEVYWLTGTIISNVIEVTDTGNVSDTYTDSAPQITIWGIDHTGAYRDTTGRGGHVNHIDSYRRLGEATLVSGLGGNLFKATSYEEGAGAYSMVSLETYLNERVEGDTLLAPLFWDSNPGNVRTRGVVYDASVEDNKAVVAAATYVSNGVVDYTLTFTNKTGSVTFNTNVAATDKLTVSGMAHDEHNGSWLIQSVQSDSPTETVVRVANSSVTSDFFDETGAAGRAGVFTDVFDTESASNFVVGDRLLSTAVSSDLTLVVSAVSGTEITLSGVVEEVPFPDGLTVNAQRTTSLVPLKTVADGLPDVTGIVRGDMLRVSGLERRVRVLHVQTQANQTVTVDSAASGLATLSTPSEHRLNAGQKVLITGGSSSVLDGEHTVISVPSDTTFTVAVDVAVAATGTLHGSLVELDEELTVEDGNSPTTFTVDGRWIPVEAPSTAQDLPKKTYIQHFDADGYDQQAVLRSASINDALYLTNQNDEVMKFDGTNVLRAGLPNWQFGVFANNNTAATAVLSIGQTVAYSSRDSDGKYFVVASALVSVGDRLYDSVSDSVFLVTAVTLDSSSTYRVTVRASDDISGAAATNGTLKRVLVYKYYARLNYLDANNYPIGTAALQSEDLVVEYAQSGGIQIKLVKQPAFHMYDFDNVEVELYRTRANGEQFFLHTRQLLDYDNYDPYLYITDSYEDESINPGGEVAGVDDIHTALLGVELGTAWDQPPRAAHITSVSGRLVLANLKGYPEASVLLTKATGASEITTANLAGKRILFRKDNTDTETTTNNTDRVAFEFVDTATTIDPTTDIAVGGGLVTITSTAHGLSSGDWVYLFHSSVGTDKLLTFSGWYNVFTTPTVDTFTFKSSNTAAAVAADCDRFATATAKEDVPVWIGNAGVDGNYGQRDGNPTTTDLSLVVARRLAAAINASQRGVSSEPWLSAFAGNDYRIGEVLVKVPFVPSTAPEVVAPSSLSGLRMFVSDRQVAADEQTSFQTLVYPSRLVRSYPNYPEIFDNPLGDILNSDSAVDINPADGQEITGVIPFFGQSATGSNVQLNQEVVVFKTNSVYLVNIETKQVQRIDSRGLGCTVPRSISVTRNGIMFANQSGVYRLNRDMTVTHVGLYMSGLWKSTVNKTQLSEATGHHYAVGRKYKLSVPVDADTYSQQVFVYDYDAEEMGQPGAWTRYTNHPAVGWCNLENDAYWASQYGDVFLVRARGEASDFRDEDQPVAQQVVVLGAEDFGVPGIRKVVASVATLVELTTTDLTNLVISVAQNLSRTFTEASTASATQDEYQQVTYRTSLPFRRGTHVQLKYTHYVKDEELVLTGVEYRVAQLGDSAVKEAANLT